MTNRSGVEWLRRHLAPRGIKVHSIIMDDPYAVHVDISLIPLSKSQ